jgi:signal transduction histidine kinase
MHRFLALPETPPGTDVSSALLRLAETIAGHTRLETLLPVIVELTSSALCCPGCLLSLWDEKRACFVPAAAHGLSARLERLFYRFPIASGDLPLVDEAVSRRRPVLAAIDDSLVPEALRRLSGDLLATSLSDARETILGVPLLHHGRVIGGMLVITDSDSFDDAGVALITGIARQTALAVASVRSFEAERRRRRDLETLQETIALLTAELELQTLYQRIVERAALTFSAPAAALFIWDENRTALPANAVHGLSAHYARQESLSVEITRRLLESQSGWRPFTLPDLRRSSLGNRDLATTERLRTALVIPLRRGERFMGLIKVYQLVRTSTFDDDALALAQAFAHQTAIALENAQLYTTLHTERERLRALSVRLTQAQEAERTRIARELHDEAGQALTTVRLQLDYVASVLPPDLPTYVHEQVREAQALAGHTLEEIRRISIDLRPSLLDDLGLTAALRWQCNRLSRHGNLQVTFDSTLDGQRLPPKVETAVYRAAQEALTNIARHAQATSVQISLDYQGGRLRLIIADDGRGFQDTGELGLGLGLLGMQERLSAVGGRLHIESRSRVGSTLHIEVPL